MDNSNDDGEEDDDVWRQIGLKCCSTEEIQPSGTNCINCGQDNGSLWDLARISNSKSRTFRQKEVENPRLNPLYVDLLLLGFIIGGTHGLSSLPALPDAGEQGVNTMDTTEIAELTTYAQCIILKATIMFPQIFHQYNTKI